MNPRIVKHCITDEKKTPEELLNLKHIAFQVYLIEAADSFGFTEKEMLQGIDLTINTWRRQKAESILISFGMSPEQAQILSSDPNWLFNFTYADIKKFLK